MTSADASDHLAGEDQEQVRWLSGGASTEEIVLAWIRANAVSRETGGPRRTFGVREVATGALVGMVEWNLEVAGFAPGVANISYGLYPEARGRGLATRAVRLLCRHLAASGAAQTAVIQVHSGNQESLAVPARAGFRHAGARRGPDGEALMIFVRRLAPARRPAGEGG